MSGYDRGEVSLYLFFAKKINVNIFSDCEHAGLWLKLGHLGRCKTWIRIKSPNNPQLLSSITCWGRKLDEKFQLYLDIFGGSGLKCVGSTPCHLIETFRWRRDWRLRLSPGCSHHKAGAARDRERRLPRVGPYQNRIRQNSILESGVTVTARLTSFHSGPGLFPFIPKQALTIQKYILGGS